MLPALDIYKMLLDGSQWGQWRGYRLPTSERCALLWTPAGTPMRWRPATWTAEDHAVAYFWPDRWYVIHAKYTPAGAFAGCYCDIVTPNPVLTPTATEARYTDLYVDVVIGADRSVATKDQEVYGRAMTHNPALAPLRERAFAELDALEADARAWRGPFHAIPDRLIRTDWELLDPAGAEFAAAYHTQWGAALREVCGP